MRLSTLLMSFLYFSSTTSTTAAAALEEDLFGTVTTAETPFFLDATTHYGNPKEGCMPDEQMLRVQGIDGDLCTPKCDAAGKCPSDVPAGVTAHPLCGLSSPTGDKYCVLLCSPSSGNDCGDAKCRTVKGQPGVGICTYDEDFAEDEEDELAAGVW